MLLSSYSIGISTTTAIVMKCVLAVVLVLVVQIQTSSFAHAKPNRMIFNPPPIEPDQTEMVVEGDPEFIGRCVERIRELLKGRGKILEEPLITNSPKFGTILRLESEISAPDENSVHDKDDDVFRIVCWNKSTMELGILMGSAYQLKPLR